MFREYTLCDFNYFKFIEVCLWPRIWSILVIISWSLEKTVCYTESGIVFYKCQLDPLGWWCCWILLYPWWFCLLILWTSESRVLKYLTINEAGAYKQKEKDFLLSISRSINQPATKHLLITFSILSPNLGSERRDMGLVGKTGCLYHVWNQCVESHTNILKCCNFLF